MKHTHEETQKREQWVIRAWKKKWATLKPGESVPATVVSDEIFKEFKQRMRPTKLYALRDKAIEELRKTGQKVPDPPRRPNKVKGAAGRASVRVADTQVRARGTVPGQARLPSADGLPTMIRLGDMSAADAVTHVLRQLTEHGLANLQVEHAGDGYVLINRAP